MILPRTCLIALVSYFDVFSLFALDSFWQSFWWVLYFLNLNLFRRNRVSSRKSQDEKGDNKATRDSVTKKHDWLTRSVGPCVAPTISVFNWARARIAGTSEPQRQFWWCASPRKIQQQPQQNIHHHHDHKTIISHHSHCHASLCSLTQLSTLTQLTRTDTLALLSNTPTLTL